MTNGFFDDRSKVGRVERDISREGSEDVLKIDCSREVAELFFIDVPGWIADDPTNYFLFAEERFPD